jgi:hypothetical protein
MWVNSSLLQKEARQRICTELPLVLTAGCKSTCLNNLERGGWFHAGVLRHVARDLGPLQIVKKPGMTVLRQNHQNHRD